MASFSASLVSRTRNALGFFALVVACEAAPALAAGTIALDYPAYDAYNAIVGTTISDDGRYAAYVLMPQDGDPTLVIHDFSKGTDVREARGTAPHFTADAKALVYTVRAPNDELRKARREHKKPADMPPSGLGIVDLATGAVTIVDRVKSVVVPKDAGFDTIAYVRGTPAPGSPSPAPTTSPTAASIATPIAALTSAPSPQPSSSASPAASPSASATPDDLHKKQDGSELVIREIPNGAETNIPHVDGYAVSHDGAYVAYAIASKAGKTDGIEIYGSQKHGLAGAQSAGPGHYRALAFAQRSEMLAYASDAATFANPAPRYAYYVVDPTAPSIATSPEAILAAGAAGLPQGWAPSALATPAFSKDARYLYVGTAPAPTPVPSGTPEPIPVDIWNYHDIDLQSVQRHDAEKERARTYLAAIDLTHRTVAQIETLGVREATKTLEPGATFALGIDTTPYRRAGSWKFLRADLYAIALADGTRRRIVTSLRDDEPSFAPTGQYVATYDEKKRTWFSTRLSDGKRVDLTSALRVPFYDELDDHPDYPPPYEFQGWLDGDRAALVADRYDVWAIDPATGRARNLTNGIGRRRHVRFKLEQLDSDATSFDSRTPILVQGLDDRTKDNELWTITTTPGGTRVHEFARVAKAIVGFARARHAERFIATERAFGDPANLYASAALGDTLAVISDSNPQMARYRTGTERLISYRSRTGIPLRGILFEPTPDGSHAKRPMLVYFYERFTDELHQMPFTTPGPGTSPNLLRYVSHGYVVFVPDIAYRTGHPGQSAYDCIMPGVDAAIVAGNVDPKRIGIAGHSWAAYQIAYLITRTNRFRAAEAGAAVANMTSAYGGIRLESGVVREIQYEVAQSRMGATPWDRPDLYLENSALFHVRNVRTPYLTIANDLDGAVPWEQGIEFFTALRRLDKEAYLFEFDGEDHNLRNRENQKYWTVHLDEFFDHFLLGTPKPDWMTHGVDFLHRGQRNVHSLFGETS